MTKVKIKDVAIKAGVSPSTVSQFLNKRYNHMSLKTRIRIEKIIEELDYQPNNVARSLKIKKTNTIGIIVANILYTFSTFMSRGIEDYCHSNGYNVILCNADNNAEKEKAYFVMLQNKQVDGVIIAATGKNLKYYENEIDKGFPVVQIDRYFSQLKTDIVLTDNYNGSFKAVEHLIDNGFNKIAIVLPKGDLLSVRKERLEGYIAALKENNIAINPNYICFMNKIDSKEILTKLFELSEQPEAIFSTNDIMAIEVLTFLEVGNIKMPESLGIISFDDLPTAHLLKTSLTVISQPAYEMGKTSARLLIERIENTNDNKILNKVVIPSKLIIRDSSVKR